MESSVQKIPSQNPKPSTLPDVVDIFPQPSLPGEAFAPELPMALIEIIPRAIMILDTTSDCLDQPIRMANAAFSELLGYEQKAIATLRASTFIREPDSDSTILDTLRSHLRQEIVFCDEVLAISHDGSELLVRCTFTPVRNDSGVMTHWIVTLQDVSQAKAEYCCSQHEKKFLVEMSRQSIMGELAGSVAHELNQPLTAVINYARGCLRRIESENVQMPSMEGAIRTMAEQAERAGEIMRRLRSLVIKAEPQRIQIPVSELFSSLRSQMDHEVLAVDVDVRYELPAELPVIEIDPIQIQQLLLNLVRNGCEAMMSLSRDSRELNISVRVMKNKRMRISVADVGQGFPVEHAEQIFQPLYTTKPNGLGMGLAISRSIAHAHGGRLMAQSRNGQGAIFHLELPIREEHED